MYEEKVKWIILKTAVICTSNVTAIVKTFAPQTLQTPEIPYNHITLFNGGPVLLTYETEEERDAEYNQILEAIQTL